MIRDARGNWYENAAALCQTCGIPVLLYYFRISQGADPVDACTMPMTPDTEKLAEQLKWEALSPVDHNGKLYADITEMCDTWGMDAWCYTNRKLNGWQTWEALTTPLYLEGEVIDPNGHKFHTVEHMCICWNVSYDLYKHRIMKGWRLLEALETPEKVCRASRPHSGLNRGRIVTDDDGYSYPSKTYLCSWKGISYDAYMQRIHRGAEPEKALTETYRKKKERPTVDHNGVQFACFEDLLDSWGLTEQAFFERYDKADGDLKMVLEGKWNNSIEITDHLGQVHESKRALCQHWHIPEHVFEYRLQAWGIENMQKIIETPIGKPRKAIPCTDHKGLTYVSETAMCRAYGKRPSLYRSRLASGYSQKQALELPAGGCKGVIKEGSVQETDKSENKPE